VHVRRQLHVSIHSDARSRHTGAVGLLQRQLQVRGVHRVGDFLAEFGEEFRDDAVAGEAFAVFRFKEFFLDDAVGINEEIAGAGKAFLHAGGFVIENTVGLDDFRIGIGEHRIVDFVAVGEEFQDFFGVIADGGEFYALFFEPRIRALQLDQLPFAEGSPVGGTEEEKDGAVRASQSFESLDVAEFVARGKIGSLLADGEADGHRFGGCDFDCVFVEGAADCYRVTEMGGDFVLRFEGIHDAVGVVVENDFCAGDIFEAFGGFVEGFVGVAGARDEDAGPGAGLGSGILCSQREGQKRKNCACTEREAPGNRIICNRGH
jgi:hypothetical protein